MSKITKYSKEGIKTASYALFWCVAVCKRLMKREEQVRVLMYHAVEPSPWKYSVDPNAFEEQLTYLARHYSVVPLHDVVAFVGGEKKLPQNTVALTLDDGYVDTFTTVFPLLKKYQLPMTVFLTTDLREQPSLGNLPRLSWDQVKEMQASGLVTFEVHGHTHQNCTHLSLEALREELLVCQSALQEKLGYSSHIMAYAFGRRSKQVEQAVKDMGFKAAFATTEGVVRKGDNMFALKRIQVDKTVSLLRFKLRLTEAVELHRRFVHRIRSWYGKS